MRWLDNLKRKNNPQKKWIWAFVVFVFSSILLLAVRTYGENLEEKTDAIESEKPSHIMRVIITTTGPAKYSHYQKDGPPRIVINFKTKNVYTKMQERLQIDQGVISAIESKFYRRHSRVREDAKKGRLLKSLIIELKEKTSYNISQKDDTIFVDITNPPGLEVKEGVLGRIEITDRLRTEEELIEKDKALREAIQQAEIELVGKKITPEEISEPIKQPVSKEEKMPKKTAEIKIPPSPKQLPITLQETDKKKVIIPSPNKERRIYPFLSSILYIFTFGIGFVIGFFVSRRYSLKKSKPRRADKTLEGFEELQEVSPGILGRLILKTFERRGYKVNSVNDFNSKGLVGIIQRDNEKALFKYICKGSYFDSVFVENFLKEMKENNANKGYVVTIGSFTYPARRLVEEKGVELIGREQLVELIHEYLEDVDLIKELEGLRQDLDSKDKNLVEKTAQYRELELKLGEKNKLIQDLTEELQDLRNKLNKSTEVLEEKEKNFTQEITSNQNKLDELNVKIENLRVDLNRKMQELIEERNNYEKLKRELTEKDKLINKLEKDLAKKEIPIVDEELKAKVAESEKLIEQLRQREARINENLVSKTKLIEELKETQQSSRKDLMTAQSQYSQLKQKYDELASKIDEKDRLLKENQALVERLKLELSEQKKLLETKEKEKEDIRRDLISHKREVTKLRKENQELVGRIEGQEMLDLTPLGEKGVLLSTKEITTAVKGLSERGISFIWKRQLDLTEFFPLKLYFFGNLKPLKAKGKVAMQYRKKRGEYFVKVDFTSLRPKDKKTIAQFIDENRRNY